MSVFHRIDRLNQIPLVTFLPLMVRLRRYDGAVRHAYDVELEAAFTAPTQPSPSNAPEAPPVQPKPHTRDELAAMNRTREYGPLGLNQQVGVFDLG